MFDQDGKLYAVGKQGPAIGGLSDKDWDRISKGRTLVVNSDFKRFGQEGVTFVVLPYLNNGTFIGGILLTSPISGSSAMVHRVNQFILYTIIIALVVSFLLSWFYQGFM